MELFNGVTRRLIHAINIAADIPLGSGPFARDGQCRTFVRLR